MNNSVIAVCVIIIFIVSIIFIAYKSDKSAKKRAKARLQMISQAGLEHIIHQFYKKDGIIFYCRDIEKPGQATPIEITGVSEIRKNAQLVGLEFRYRMDGSIKSHRLYNHGQNELLTIADKLGYGN